MDTLSFKQHIESLFKKSQKFSDSEDNLDIHTILESIESIDAELIKVLKNDKKAKEAFFTQVEDIYILNQNRLIEFFTLNDYMKNGSYTSYTNKIGLIKKDRFIKKFDDIVLAFPHKDCVLEGGQTKDEDKSKEVFYNEIIASDEIDRLFEPKVLTNIKKYSKDGIEENPMIQDDDNLIIKGNNLIALHSLKKKYAGQIKLIYIDPPYNTGNDSFKYNDNFNHSTWLTFMKNRLEVARELLSDDGVIFVQCDNNEESYLKVLMDELFGFNNYINTISVKSSTPSGVKTSHATKKILKSQDFILCYKKFNIQFYPQYSKKEKWDTHYMFYIENNQLKLLINVLKSENILKKHETLQDFDVKNKVHKRFYINNGNNIVRKSTHDNKKIKELCNKKYKDIIYEENGNKYFNNDMLQPIAKSIQPVFIGQNIEDDISNLVCDFWNDIDFQNTQNQGGVSFPAGKKPEQLLYRIIAMVTQPNDLVMDFHLGSGTTCAVAHKMGRKYIGIEQMDYIEDIAVERLKKVIDGEQGGISKAVNWSGGGSFVYAELKQIDNFKNSKIESLNKNMQYLPIDEIEDEDYGITKEEIAINRSFYGIENE
ncbi:MAG: site-specific DNA-methyltransferase [Arcobacteraceae bacterium]